MKIDKERIREAVKLYTKFHWGKLPQALTEVRIPLTKEFVFLGKLLGVIYLSDKSGEPEVYVHFFGKNEPFRLVCDKGRVSLERTRKVSYSQIPDLLTDPEGKTLYIANFKGKVKEEGITG